MITKYRTYNVKTVNGTIRQAYLLCFESATNKRNNTLYPFIVPPNKDEDCPSITFTQATNNPNTFIEVPNAPYLNLYKYELNQLLKLYKICIKTH